MQFCVCLKSRERKKTLVEEEEEWGGGGGRRRHTLAAAWEDISLALCRCLRNYSVFRLQSEARNISFDVWCLSINQIISVVGIDGQEKHHHHRHRNIYAGHTRSTKQKTPVIGTTSNDMRYSSRSEPGQPRNMIRALAALRANIVTTPLICVFESLPLQPRVNHDSAERSKLWHFFGFVFLFMCAHMRACLS